MNENENNVPSEFVMTFRQPINFDELYPVEDIDERRIAQRAREMEEDTVCGLIEHYKDPSCCMFFEPMLTSPLHRNFPFSLQHLARAVICDHTTYDGVTMLPLPRSLKEYLMYYHYKQKVRMRRMDNF
ncbi:hypothetical protein KUTeg_013433 [Tegillarca granosa]|uniref:SOCS box domain-containing protein n=1 Tax=Tegillarca granosa TaxID=220873 RepID=A0ABQ9ETN6_TEGGR|nr:hypothetical protein KUTeg_013433 [Tegillarca granosa]